MTTLEKLQTLDDGQFHRLADAILKRIEPKYRNLRTHGVNDQGISIKGQPDSYVGNSARTCSIAFCYNTDSKDWWNKIRDDVTLALQTSPNLQEIVIALPRDVDRDGPKGKKGGEKIDWEQRLNQAANNKLCSVYDGRRLSGFLDDKYQDLRYEYLGIPFSRLSSAAIIASCQQANQLAIADLTAKGRYQPQHYVSREADDRLKQLWREAFGSKKGCRLIPVINDSGLGKTSLLCSFAEALGGSLPVLLIQARDCGFHSEDALVRLVMQRLQGVLSPALQMQEEVALTGAISNFGVLTVLLDGLDEVRNPPNVSRALKFWLESAIGRASILIVSSRPDFWRRCSEQSWERYITPAKSNDRSSASKPDEQPARPENWILGHTLPERFSPDELRLAWKKFGLPESELDGAPHEVRQELSHPLTLRAWVEIFKSGKTPKLPNTRDEIVELWIRTRLEKEADSVLGMSQELLWNVMVEVAKRIDAGGETHVSVDQLAGVPRFDAAHPPGEAVLNLINANLLEFIEGKNDSIRFVFDTVYEFFLAEIDVEAIRRDCQAVVSSIGSKTFSKTATRLGRIGSRLAGTPEGDAFARALANLDYAKALVVIQGRPDKFLVETRQFIFDKCRELFWKSTRPEMAFMIERIGYVNCDEAREALSALVLPWEHCPAGLQQVASYSIIRLNLTAGIPLLLRASGWFNSYFSYYHQNVFPLLRNSSDNFKEALAKTAIESLEEPSGTFRHAQAVSVLGYLRDERIVEHLHERLQSNNELSGYENHALFAVGSAVAAEFFQKFAIAAAARIEAARGTKDEDLMSRLWDAVSFRTADLSYLVTEPFEKSIIGLIDGSGEMACRLGVDLATSSRKPSLIRHIIFSGKVDIYPFWDARNISESISTSEWLDWWKEAKSKKIMASLLRFSGEIPDVRIENIAIDCLEIPELCASAAEALARLGSVRCLPFLRDRLESTDIKTTGAWGLVHSSVRAFRELRDGEAVQLLARVATETPHSIRKVALDALANIGTEEAANAIIDLSTRSELCNDHSPIQAMIAHGSLRTVDQSIEIAKRQPEGPKWLVKQIRHVFMMRGWTVGEYYTHVQDEALIEYLLGGEANMSDEEKRELIHSFKQIDSGNVRRMLWIFANRAGTDKDVKIVISKIRDGHMLSSEALEDLINRGDVGTFPNVLSSALDCEEFMFSHQIEGLAKFPNSLVVSEVVNRLRNNSQVPEEIVRLLAILGTYGSSIDAPAARSYLTSEDESVRNISDETTKLLLDPLRVTAAWRESWLSE